MFPTEILLEIFEAACTDDGTTGRALSRVSRHFYAASKHLKFQSISLTTPSQLLHFASLLQHSLPRVRHLFVSNIRSTPSSTVITTPSPHFWQSEDASAAFIRILVLVAPTLETLSVVSNIPRTFLLIPVSLPLVTTITLHGQIHVSGRHTAESPTFPSLRHLSLLSFADTPPRMLEDISRMAPRLVHLTLAPELPSRQLPSSLSLPLSPPRSPTFLPFVEQISVLLSKAWQSNLWTNLTRNVMLRDLNEVAEIDGRIKVVEAAKVYPCHAAKYFWLQGGF